MEFTEEDIQNLLNAADEYADSFDTKIENTDFSSILYITTKQQKQLAFDMINSMTLYELRQLRELNITKNIKVLILTNENRQQYWEDIFKEFSESIEIYHSLDILFMNMLSYTNNQNYYSVIMDINLGDLISLEGLIQMNNFLSLPFIYDKFSYRCWITDEDYGFIASMFLDKFPTQLAFREALNNQTVAEMFGNNEDGTLKEPTDFKMYSNNNVMDCGLQKPLNEAVFKSKYPIGRNNVYVSNCSSSLN